MNINSEILQRALLEASTNLFLPAGLRQLLRVPGGLRHQAGIRSINIRYVLEIAIV